MAVSSVTGWAAPTMAVVASSATAWGAGARLCRMTKRSPWLYPCDILLYSARQGGDPNVGWCDASEGLLSAQGGNRSRSQVGSGAGSSAQSVTAAVDSA